MFPREGDDNGEEIERSEKLFRLSALFLRD